MRCFRLFVIACALGAPAAASAAITLTVPSPTKLPALTLADTGAAQDYTVLRTSEGGATGCLVGPGAASFLLVQPFSVPYLDPGLADGLWCYVLAGSGDGMVSNAVVVRVDNTAPTTSLTAPAAGPVRGVVGVGGTAADSGSGLATVDFLAGVATLAGVASGASYSATWDTTTTPDGPATVALRAVDAVGNVSTATRAVLVDNTAPTATFNAPLDQALTTGTVGLSASVAENGSGLVSVSFEASSDGGVSWRSIGSEWTSAAGNVFVPWVTTAADDGTYGIRLRARDAAGNAGLVYGPVGVRVDNGPPASPAVQVGTTTYAAGAPTITWIASTSSDVIGYRVYRDGDLAHAIATLGPTTTFVDTDPLTDGAHVYRIVASDGILSSLPSVAISVVVDTMPPLTPASLAAAVAPGTRDVTLSWSAASDPSSGGATGSGVAAYRLLRDGAVLATVSADATSFDDTTTSDATSYAYAVAAVDYAGNLSSGATALITTPDITPPGAPGRIRYRLRGETLSISWARPGDADLARIVVVSGSHAPASLSDGRLAFRGLVGSAEIVQRAGTRRWYAVFAVDRAGNATAAAPFTIAVAPSALFPVDGSVVSRAVTLRWKRVAKATYYNVQVWSGSRKLVDVWPTARRLGLPTGTFRPGRRYTWYVWPGIGAPASRTYGPLIGHARFVYR